MKKSVKIILSTVLVLLFTACAQSTMNYTPPSNFNSNNIQTTKVINKDYNKAWDELVNKLSENSFVINNMSKESGFINLDFSITNPTKYVDCGRWNGHFKNLSGEANYNFSGVESSRYTNMAGTSMVNVESRKTLSGKINILLQKIEPMKQTYKINVKYVLSGIDTGHVVYPSQIVHQNWTVGFSSKERGRNSIGQIECQTTGMLEADLLNFISE